MNREDTDISVDHIFQHLFFFELRCIPRPTVVTI